MTIIQKHNTIFKKHDEGKTKWSYLPLNATEKVVKVIELGASKYGKDNWKNVTDLDRLYDACIRHLVEWKKGEKYDQESHYSHLAHAVTNILFLLEVDK